ncbi:glycine--tRNA ligase, beta subunit [Ehrlichia chaffeensis str. Heartland]|uniref:Glycine--tRNA ligase beta subunit n=1 Tax=Ehrlichia chaffeensis (strain ATCC CRL-10679 / Arkansas) TaxID=205920 RepID=Q2GI76_EHRCR|nr:glycine--tRNA ligase subunit beta [Ehrlichia chaffeensis]ABD44644.1 glycyl-tRNA synthetase, beta subunit [Ehrlichia chaffeensis str. Arkansas]AHX03187.1 glycine--tRNA ligase, beta subunit [Ehrlichia chaffeensis str. Heartland]AHX05103.1 glycine--tRNA ligase, beta subunit [Ehrlichia chaffeensis str. Jax]AHX06092.1 glycine--tRNA ligase, beta subunit [Ehrlichia chaffeensis str. Liberty]AHX07278.1 glycine--tRNA ligase, beta subunit [Ehrlichia chaffeensis str. Osceola]
MPLELLFECLSEETPPEMQSSAYAYMDSYIRKELSRCNISFESVKVFVTSNRLTLYVKNIINNLSNNTLKIKGPKVSADKIAIEGFLKKVNKNFSDLITCKIGNDDFYYAELNHNEETNTEHIILSIIENMLNNFPWDKKMRWGGGKTYWVRPILNIMCILDGKVLPIKFADIEANNKSCGNRFTNKEFFEVADFNSYNSKLKKNNVILCQKERLNFILHQIKSITEESNLICEDNQKLINKLNGTLEYPIVIMGSVDEKFSELPKELILSVMHNHQKYLAVFKEDKITNFITISTISNDNIIKGHNNILNARLLDASFLVKKDKEYNIDYYIEKLKQIVFHAKLGSVFEKVNRIIALSKYISIWIPHSSLIKVERAAKLSKFDLSTLAIKEFPELQGIMGGYYASYFNESLEISESIVNHYEPTNPQKECPSSPISIAVSISDKIDNLVGMIVAGEQVTSSRDPFSMRRMAISIIRIIIENNLNIPIRLLIEKSVSLYSFAITERTTINKLKNVISRTNRKKEIISSVIEFFSNRFKIILKEDGIKEDIINAVFESRKFSNLLLIKTEAKFLNNYIFTKNGVEIIKAYKRLSNIITKGENVNNTAKYKCNKKLFTIKEETDLYKEITYQKNNIKRLIKDNKFEESLNNLYKLSCCVNSFMDNVKVNDQTNKELHKNRLSIVKNAFYIFDLVTDFSKIKNTHR